MTREEFLARIKLPLGAEIGELKYLETQTFDAVKNMEPVTQANMVACWITASSKEIAAEGAQAVMAAIEGLETIIRVEPEAHSQLDFTTGKWHHKGYVRFGFFDRPGPVHPSPKFDGEMRYLGLAKAPA